MAYCHRHGIYKIPNMIAGGNARADTGDMKISSAATATFTKVEMYSVQSDESQRRYVYRFTRVDGDAHVYSSWCTPIGGHVYYASALFHTNTTGNTATQYVISIETYGGTAFARHYAATEYIKARNTTGHNWLVVSTTATANADNAGIRTVFGGWSGNYTNGYDYAWWLMMDLTQWFGAGQEPDKAWCDEHISVADDGDILIVGEGIPYLMNQVRFGDFEAGILPYTGEWMQSKTGFVVNSTKPYRGLYSLQAPAATTADSSTTFAYSISTVPGHKYYESVYIADNAAPTKPTINSYVYAKNYALVTSGDSLGNATTPTLTDGNWYMYSQIITVPANVNLVANNIRHFSTQVAYIDNWMIVDLTKYFGAGNEPDKAWCDAHLRLQAGGWVTYEDTKVTYRNLIPNSDFSTTDLGFWNRPVLTNVTTTYDSKPALSGRAIGVNSTIEQANASAVSTFYQINVLHRYYFLCYVQDLNGLDPNLLFADYRRYDPSYLKTTGALTEITMEVASGRYGHDWTYFDNTARKRTALYSGDKATGWYKCGLLVDNFYTPRKSSYLFITLGQRSRGASNKIFNVSNVMLVDLSKDFGVGNEPSLEWCWNNLNWVKDGGSIVTPYQQTIRLPREVSGTVLNMVPLPTIIDRTSRDAYIARREQSSNPEDMKGAWNVSDLRRVENQTKWLAEYLTYMGYPVEVNVKLDWQQYDLPYIKAHINRIRTNVDNLRKTFLTAGNKSLDVPTIAMDDYMDYTKANNLELIYQLTVDCLNGMMKQIPICGQHICGELY